MLFAAIIFAGQVAPWLEIDYDDVDPRVHEYVQEYVFRVTGADKITVDLVEVQLVKGINYRFTFSNDMNELVVVVWSKLDGSLAIISNEVRQKEQQEYEDRMYEFD